MNIFQQILKLTINIFQHNETRIVSLSYST
jgi:hypothetical protein